MRGRELFVPTDAWSARPSDANDTFVAQLALEPGPDAGRGAIGLFGVPYDGAVIGRKGARGGPAAIRRQMAKLKPWWATATTRGALPRPLTDWGDVALAPDAGVLATHERVHAAAAAIVAAGSLPVALGGDHSLTFPLATAAAAGRRIGVINLDAHLDVRETKGEPNSGTSFARLLDSGTVPGPNLVEVGIRDFANSPAYVEKVRAAGGTIVGADAWRAQGVAAIDRAIKTAAHGVEGVYLTVDVDVLDEAHAPGVSAPTPDGIDTATLYAAIRRIASRAPLVGADFVEVAPSLDRDDMTSRAAAYGVMHLLTALPSPGVVLP